MDCVFEVLARARETRIYRRAYHDGDARERPGDHVSVPSPIQHESPVDRSPDRHEPGPGRARGGHDSPLHDADRPFGPVHGEGRVKPLTDSPHYPDEPPCSSPRARPAYDRETLEGERARLQH